jgi:hypothetical protein
MPITLNGDTGITTPTYGGADTSEYLVPVTSFKNRIINGAMQIDQRNAGASISIANTEDKYPVDRFFGSNRTGTAVFSGQQSTTAPEGFKNSLLITTTTANASLSATQYAAVRHSIEGFNVYDLDWGAASAKPVTLSFWVRSSLTGTFGGSLTNAGFNRSYPFTYTISSANTWEQKTITIAGDTTGTWATNNTAGIHIFFGLGVGSTVSGTAGAWAGSAFYSASGATSVVGTNGATFYITGVQLEKGSTATSFDYRPYGTELALCQRYYYQSWGSGSGTNSGNAFMSMPIPNSLSNSIGTSSFPVSMRAIPTVTLYDDVFTSGTASQPGLSNNLSANAIIININGFAQASRPSGSFTTGYPIRCHYIANIEL